jgi:hypothetical protein
MKSKSENNLPSQKPKPIEGIKVNRRMKKRERSSPNPLIEKEKEETQSQIVEQPLVKEKLAEIDNNFEKLNLTNNSQTSDDDLKLNFNFNTLDPTIIVTTGKVQAQIVEHLLVKEKVAEIDDLFDGEFVKPDSKIKPQIQNVKRKSRSQSVPLNSFSLWGTNSKSTKTKEKKEQKNKNSDLKTDNDTTLLKL